MCPSIEEYANKIALDAAINMALNYCSSKDQLIKTATEQFYYMPRETVISRIDFFWDKKE